MHKEYIILNFVPYLTLSIVDYWLSPFSTNFWHTVASFNPVDGQNVLFDIPCYVCGGKFALFFP